jgi:hypothetical protein
MIFNITFPTFCKEEFEAKLYKLNLKLKQKGDSQVQILHETLQVQKVDTDFGLMDIIFSNTTLEVNGEARIPGYQIKAVIDIRDGVRFARTFDPNFNAELAQTDHCDHCNTKRARNQVFILQGHNEVKTVGSTCMKDFTGMDIAGQLKPIFKFMDEETKSTTTFHFGNTLMPANLMVSAVLHTADKHPEFYKNYSHIAVQNHIVQNGALHENTQNILDQLFTKHKSVDPNTSTYFHNVFHALFYPHGTKRELFSRKSVNIITYLVYQLLKKEEPVQAPKESQFVGQLESVISVKGKVELAKPIQNKFGKAMLISIKDENSNVIKCFSASKAAFNIQPNSQITMTGLVAKHDLYQGQKNTLLKKCKFA